MTENNNDIFLNKNKYMYISYIILNLCISFLIIYIVFLVIGFNDNIAFNNFLYIKIKKNLNSF